MKEGSLPPVEKIKVSPEDGLIRHTFSTNEGRTLVVTLLTDQRSFGSLGAATRIDARAEQRKVPGSTTALYTKARELMQQAADERGEVLYYTFSTYSRAMIAWAMTAGQELFDWEDMTSPVPNEEFILHSHIFPRE